MNGTGNSNVNSPSINGCAQVITAVDYCGKIVDPHAWYQRASRLGTTIYLKRGRHPLCTLPKGHTGAHEHAR